MATEIPEDIVVDILKRLPVKSLMRFQCVSPTWRVLIKSPFFRNMHTKHHKLLSNTSSSRIKEDEYILVSGSPRTKDGYAEFSFYARGNSGELVPMQPLPAFFAFPHSKIELCATCNGIFCVATKVDGNELYLCNPATREWRRLPERPFGFHSDKFPRSGVSHVVRTAWGFGVVPGTDNLKVVSVMYYGTPGDRYYFYKTNDLYETLVMRHCPFVMKHGIIQFEIFDLSSDTWREVDVVLPDVLGLVKRKKKSRNIRKNRNKDERYVYTMDHWAGGGLFLNGCLHWLYNVCVGEFILSFDMGSETMQAFEVPVHVNSRHPSRYDTLMVLGDCLAMVVQSARVAPISIWVMEEHGVRESWVKRFNLAPYSVPLNILHSWKDDDGDLLLFQAVVSNWTETLVSCNTFGDRYHTYHTRAVNERYLVLQAIVVSDQTMASVRPTTCDHTLVSGESTMMQADTGGFCPLLEKAFAWVSLAGCWRIARWLSLLAVMFVLFFDSSVA